MDCMGPAMEIKGVCWVCWTYMGPAAETSLRCLLGLLDCLGPALLTGKGCLLSVLDYLGPAAETGLGHLG